MCFCETLLCNFDTFLKQMLIAVLKHNSFNNLRECASVSVNFDLM